MLTIRNTNLLPEAILNWLLLFWTIFFFIIIIFNLTEMKEERGLVASENYYIILLLFSGNNSAPIPGHSFRKLFCLGSSLATKDIGNTKEVSVMWTLLGNFDWYYRNCIENKTPNSSYDLYHILFWFFSGVITAALPSSSNLCQWDPEMKFFSLDIENRKEMYSKMKTWSFVGFYKQKTFRGLYVALEPLGSTFFFKKIS